MTGLSVALASRLPFKSSVPAAAAASTAVLPTRLAFIAGGARRDPLFKYLDVKLQWLDLILRLLVHDRSS
jgi:hypothetical protein